MRLNRNNNKITSRGLCPRTPITFLARKVTKEQDSGIMSYMIYCHGDILGLSSRLLCRNIALIQWGGESHPYQYSFWRHVRQKWNFCKEKGTLLNLPPGKPQVFRQILNSKNGKPIFAKGQSPREAYPEKRANFLSPAPIR